MMSLQNVANGRNRLIGKTWDAGIEASSVELDHRYRVSDGCFMFFEKFISFDIIDFVAIKLSKKVSTRSSVHC